MSSFRFDPPSSLLSLWRSFLSSLSEDTATYRDYLLIAMNTHSSCRELLMDYFLVAGEDLESVRDLYVVKGLRVNFPE